MGSPDWTQLSLGSRRGILGVRNFDAIEELYDSQVSGTAPTRVYRVHADPSAL